MPQTVTHRSATKMSSYNPITAVTSNDSTESSESPSKLVTTNSSSPSSSTASSQSTIYPDAPPAYSELPPRTAAATQTAKLPNQKRTFKSIFTAKARIEQEASVEVQDFSPEVLAAISIFPTVKKMSIGTKPQSRESHQPEVITNPFSRFRPDDLKEPGWLDRKFF